MVTATLIALALILGYVVTIGLSLAVTLWIGSAKPSMVTDQYRIRNSYKLLQEAVWLVCAAIGAYLTALVAGDVAPFWFVGSLLAAALIAVLWSNSWEARQRGLGHQILMTLVSICGVVAGYMLRMRSSN
jgi:hypothetical protein